MNRPPVAIFLLVLCLGCPKRIAFGPEGELTDPAAVLQRVQQAEARIQAAQGEARLGVDSPQQRGSVGLFVAARRPALLHLEPLDFFGRPLGVLASDGDTFGLYSAEENRVYRGPASPENVSRFLPVVLPAPELVAVMLGEAPRLQPESLALAVDSERRAYRLTLRRGEVVQTLWVHPTLFRVVRSEVRGTAAYDLAFDDFLERDGLVFPRKVVLASQAGQARLELSYKDVTLNGEADPELFQLVAPEGVPVVEVDARGEPLPPGS
jgi:hypothetical protein